jgi:hypothetical protein
MNEQSWHIDGSLWLRRASPVIICSSKRLPLRWGLRGVIIEAILIESKKRWIPLLIL